MGNRRRRKVEARKRINRTVRLTLGILLVVYLLFSLVFGENGLLRYFELRSLNAAIQRDIRNLERQNRQTQAQIDALKKNPNLLEELARKQGLTRDGELIFKFKKD